MKTILTGFSIFGDNTGNPTETIAKAFRDREGISSFVLPVEYDNSWEIIKDTSADLYIHMGLASSREYITVEKSAYNEKNASIPDNAGVIFKGEKIAQDGSDMLETPVDISLIIDSLTAKGIKASLSRDPGRYVCNNIYYHSLRSGNRALFMHFPPLDKSSLEDDIRAVEVVITLLKTSEIIPHHRGNMVF